MSTSPLLCAEAAIAAAELRHTAFTNSSIERLLAAIELPQSPFHIAALNQTAASGF